MTEYAGQAVIHALVAALVVEALIRLWRIVSPDLRLQFRLLTLGFPLVVLPAFSLLVPERAERFREQWAIFAVERWREPEILGVGAAEAGLAILAGVSLVLFLSDLIPFLSERFGSHPLRSELSIHEGEALTGEVQGLARILRLTPPRVVLLDGPAPVLLSRGIHRPLLILSRRTIELLDGPELRAALAHELAHLGRRDLLFGWLLMAARALMFFNPVVQVVVRTMVRELEWRADDLAAKVTGTPLALAGGLVKLFRDGGAGPVQNRRHIAGMGWLARRLDYGRARSIERRCRRLLDPSIREPVPLATARLALTGSALLCLLFFVV